MVSKNVEPMMGGREKSMVDWVVGAKLREHERVRETVVSGGLKECKCKIFYQYFKCKTFYTCLR